MFNYSSDIFLAVKELNNLIDQNSIKFDIFRFTTGHFLWQN